MHQAQMMKKLAALMAAVTIASKTSAATQPATRPDDVRAKMRMVSIPEGQFVRSDGQHVPVGAFSLFSTEASWSQFATVASWGRGHGYDISGGIGEGDRPAQNITWHDAVKWCNALSEMTGRQPVYYTDVRHREVYRQGRVDLTAAHLQWDANGFRLPTEAEWEYAYRAGTTTNTYWGEHSRAAQVNHDYAVFHVWATDEIDGGPQPPGTKKPNAFGLFDMAGNVEEWVWDRYASDYPAPVAGQRSAGPDTGPLRVLRGGSFVIDRFFGAADRHPTYPWYVDCDMGFRVASSDPTADGTPLVRIPALPLAPNDIKPFATPVVPIDTRPDTDAAAVARLIPLLDLDAPELKDFKAAYERHDDPAALTALHDLYMGRLASGALSTDGHRIHTDRHVADRWLGVYKADRPARWFGPDTDNNNVWSTHAPDTLLTAWASTGNRGYFDAYVWAINQSALYAKPTWDRLTRLEKGSGGSPRDSFYSYVGFDACRPLIPFLDLSWAMAHAPKGQKVEIPPRVLANVIHSLLVDRIPLGLQDDRKNVPNQIWGNALNLVRSGRFYREFRDAPLWSEIGLRRIQTAAKTVMADGTDLEASLNYNFYVFDHIARVNELFPEKSSRPEWLNRLNMLADYRRYVYPSLTTPLGSLPSLGTGSDEITVPRDRLKNWLAKGQLDGFSNNLATLLGNKAPTPNQDPSAAAPVFTSVALPFGGYYVQRSGWSSDDLYCFMRSGRAGAGHNRHDNNCLQIYAYGAPLLLEAGSGNYDNRNFMPTEQRPYLPYFSERDVGNPYFNNLVTPGGFEQSNPSPDLSDPTAGYDTPRPLRFHTSPAYDLMEGSFDGVYHSETPIDDQTLQNLVADYGLNTMSGVIAHNARLKNAGADLVQGIHNRQVILLRDLKFWIVIDRMGGKAAGLPCVQTWHFPPPSEGLNPKSEIGPGFDPNQVRWSQPNKSIVTIARNRPNLSILNFIDAPVSYSQHFGEKFPFRGWYTFGIVGERVPAVTMAAEWRSDAPLVSVLLPGPAKPDTVNTIDAGLEPFVPRNTAAISGFTRTSGQDVLTVQAAREADDLVAGPIKARAASLLLRQATDGRITGIALDCSKFSVGDQSQIVGTPDFEFTILDGKLQATPILAPSTFRWDRRADGQLVPAYH